MDKLKFTVYDIFGYVIPGLILIWFVRVFCCVLSSASQDFGLLDYDITLADVLVFIPLAYAIGHLMHAITKKVGIPSKNSLSTYLQEWSNKIKSDESNTKSGKVIAEQNLSEKHKQYYCPDLAILRKCIQSVFLVKDSEADKLTEIGLATKYYWACNIYVLKHNPKSITETFYGLLGFYRSMFLVSLLISILFLLGFLLSNFNYVSIIIFIIALISSSLFRFRINDFSAYHYAAVFTDFVVIALEKSPIENEKQKKKFEERFTICERLVRDLSSIYSSVTKESSKI